LGCSYHKSSTSILLVGLLFTTMASQPDQQTVDDVSYIMSSDYRMAVVEALNDGMATPSTICEFHGGREELAIAHASRALQELKKRNIVDLLVSENRKKGRIYGLTEQGKEAGKHALEM